MAVTGISDEMWAGNRRVLKFTVLDADATTSTPLDLTGRVVKFALARFSQSGAPIVSSPVVDKASDTDPTNVAIKSPASAGVVWVTLTPTDTAALARAGDELLYMELEVYDAGEVNPVVVLTGTETVHPNVVNA